MVVAACTGWVAACSESSGPPAEGLEGRYTLVAANGAALPVTLYTGLGPPTQVVGGSLTVMTRGRVREVRELRAGSTVVLDTREDAYRVEGSRLVVERPRLPVTQSHADTGTIGQGAVALRVRWVVSDDASPTSAMLDYRRTP